MNEVIAWATFAGAWLLVAGPLYQGSIELEELEMDREGIRGTLGTLLLTRDRPSAWWWLLPPVMYVLRRRWNKAMRKVMLDRLTPTQREQLTSYQGKAAGWFTVAGGAALLAAGETWHITEHYHWPVWVFWLLAAAMLAAAVINTAARMINGTHPSPAGGLDAAPVTEPR